jgi:hypothetical protein
MFRVLTVIAFILATVSGQTSGGNFPSPSPIACIDPATGKPCQPSPSPCLAGCTTNRTVISPTPCPYGVIGCQMQSPPPSISPVPSNCNPGLAGCPMNQTDLNATRSNPPRLSPAPSPPPSLSPYPSRSPTTSSTPASSQTPAASPDPSQKPSQTSVPSSSAVESSSPRPNQSQPPVESSSPKPKQSQPPLESSSPRPNQSQPPVESSSPKPNQSQPPVESSSPKPSSVVSRSPMPSVKPPIYSTVTFPNVDLNRITNQTIQGIQGNLSCALGINPDQVILQNATYTDRTGARYNIPFNATQVNQKTVVCSPTIATSPTHLLRQLQTSSTIFTIDYLILNPSESLNITDLVTLLSNSPLMTTTLQSLGAVPSSSTVAADSNNSLSLAVGIPLGVIAAVIVGAVALQITFRDRRLVLSPNQRPIKTVLYVTESPLSASKEVTIHSEDNERVSHNPTRIRV